MKYKELFYLAGKCLTLDDIPENRAIVKNAFSNQMVPINNFIQLCDKNLILPVIYQKFRKHELLSFLPHEIKKLLKEIYELNQKRNISILHQIDEINIQLHQEEISPVFLKGSAHLLCNLYETPGERMIGDIDLLVRENDFLKAANVMIDFGYQPLYEYYEHMISYKHYPPLYRDDRPVQLEIHRIPVDSIYSQQLSSSQVFKNTEIISGRINCFVPSDENQVILNYIHSQLSDLGYWCKKTPLRDIYDFYLLTPKVNPLMLQKLIKQSKKMRGYLRFTNRTLNINKQLNKRKDGQLHAFFCDKSLQYPGLNKQYCVVLLWFRGLFGNLNRLSRFIFQKKYRNYILNKTKS